MELLTYPTEFGRNRGNLPELPIVNLFAETAEPEGQVILQSRAGLAPAYTLSTNPTRLVYSEPGVFNEALFALVGTELYRDTTLLGTVNGDGPVSMDSFETTTFLTAGDSLYKYDGSTLSTMAFPDAAATLKIVVGASRLVVIKKVSQTIYWTTPLGTTIDALDFAQAENSPDRLLDMLFIGDTLLLFGEGTVEFWTSQTGSGDLPFAPIPGRVFSKGIKNTGAVTQLASGWAWVTDSNQICINTPDGVISTREIETEIEAANEVFLWRFFFDGIEFLAARVGDRTHVFPTTTKTWSEFQTYGGPNWEASSYSNGYFGSATTGRVLTWSEDYIDDGELERRFRVWYPFNMETAVVNSIFMRANPGRTTYLAGEYDNPRVEMRTSKDGGNTFSAWRTATMGAVGQYRKQVKWLACGLFSYPGALAEFRITDPTPFRVSSVTANEPYGGY